MYSGIEVNETTSVTGSKWLPGFWKLVLKQVALQNTILLCPMYIRLLHFLHPFDDGSVRYWGCTTFPGQRFRNIQWHGLIGARLALLFSIVGHLDSIKVFLSGHLAAMVSGCQSLFSSHEADCAQKFPGQCKRHTFACKASDKLLNNQFVATTFT